MVTSNTRKLYTWPFHLERVGRVFYICNYHLAFTQRLGWGRLSWCGLASWWRERWTCLTFWPSPPSCPTSPTSSSSSRPLQSHQPNVSLSVASSCYSIFTSMSVPGTLFLFKGGGMMTWKKKHFHEKCKILESKIWCLSINYIDSRRSHCSINMTTSPIRTWKNWTKLVFPFLDFPRGFGYWL